MRSGESDAALVRAAQAGDKAAFAVLLGRHRPVLLALCRRALADPALGEDAAQEAALTAYLNLDRLRQPDRFGPWLAGIGLNICRRITRDRSRDGWSWEELVGGSRAFEPPAPGAGPDALAEAADLARRTHHLIDALPPGQRAAVTHFYLSDRTHDETAARLGISVGAVKTRLHKARASLRRALLMEGDHEMNERLSRRTLTKGAAALTGGAAARMTASNAGAMEAGSMAGQQDARALVPVRVADVRRKSAEDGKAALHVVLLEEVDGTRRLPVWIGQPEGTTLALHLERADAPRPLTVAFAASLLDAAGGKLREVRVDRLVETVFYATAVVETPGGNRTVDARPSDAINLALIAGVPILVASGILDSAQTTDDLFAGTEGASEIAADWMVGWPAPTSATE